LKEYHNNGMMYHKHHLTLLKRQTIDQKNRSKQTLFWVETDTDSGNILITQMHQFQDRMEAGIQIMEEAITEAHQDQIMETMQIIHLILIIV
jgi:hypothetical protein